VENDRVERLVAVVRRQQESLTMLALAIGGVMAGAKFSTEQKAELMSDVAQAVDGISAEIGLPKRLTAFYIQETNI
jgi:hypothetical protein